MHGGNRAFYCWGALFPSSTFLTAEFYFPLFLFILFKILPLLSITGQI